MNRNGVRFSRLPEQYKICEGSPAGAQREALALPIVDTFVVTEKTSSPSLPLQLCPNRVLHTCLLKEAASTAVKSSGVPSSVVVSKLERPYLSNEGEGSAVSAMQISKHHILSTC